MIPGHECTVYCTGDEHCELVWSTFDHHPSGAEQSPPFESVRRHYDDAYRRRYGARVARTEPAREPRPLDQMDPAELTPLVGHGGETHAWLIWFVPPGPAAEAFTAADEAAYQARLAAARTGGPRV